jgi:hypothetical protein
MTKHTEVIARNKAVVRAYYDGAERGDSLGISPDSSWMPKLPPMGADRITAPSIFFKWSLALLNSDERKPQS